MVMLFKQNILPLAASVLFDYIPIKFIDFILNIGQRKINKYLYMMY